MAKSLHFFRATVSIAALITAAAAGAPSTAAPADVAQNPPTTAQEPAPEEAIIVTGSRIRRDPLNQSSPVITLDQDDLEKTGLSSVADGLPRLPHAGARLCAQ